MTATKSSFDKSPIVTPSYIVYSTKRLWAVALLIVIALFFSTSVPLMMQLGDFDQRLLTAEDIKDRIENMMFGLTVTAAIVSAFAAFFTGSFALSFFHNKVSAGFYHSLPEKRSGHFLASLISSVAVYIGPAILNIFIVFLTFLTNGYMYGYVVTLIWQLLFYSAFYYVVFLAVSFLAGTLSGSSAIHAIMSFYIVFVLPVIFISSYLWLEMGVTYLRTYPDEWIISIGHLISPVFRMIKVFTTLNEETTASPLIYLLVDAVISAVMFYIAYRLYRVRPIERAGTPIIYKPVSEAIKYSIMFPAALLMGYMFCEFGGLFWLIFGTVAGAVLSFMLMNTVLNRTAKAMFSGMKGFGVFAAVSLVLMITLVTGIFGYADYHIPAAKEITVNVDGDGYSLTDGEIREFRKLMKEFNEGLRSGEIDNAIEYYDYENVIVYEEGGEATTEKIDGVLNDMIAKGESLERTASIRVEYTNFLGITSTYRYNNFKYSDLGDILALVADSEANKTNLPDTDTFKISEIYFNTVFPAAFVDELGLFEGTMTPDLVGTAGYNINVSLYPRNSDYALSEASNRELIEFIRARSTESSSKQAIGSLHYSGYTDNGDVAGNSRGIDYGYNYNSGFVTLYAEDIPTLIGILYDYVELCEVHVNDRYTGEHYYIMGEKSSVIFDKLSKMDSEDFIAEQTASIKYAIVINNADKTATKVVDKEKLYEVVSAASHIGVEALLSTFAPTDSDYTVIFSYNGVAYDSFVAYFYPDKIPSFLK